MAYGTVKVDNITFDNGGSDQNVTVSGLYNSLTSGVSVTGTISGSVVIGSTSVSGTTVLGTTVTGTTVQGVSGTFTSLTGTTITGTTINGVTVTSTTGTFTSLTGTTITGTTLNGVTVAATTGSFTSLTGTTTSGTTANFVSGVFTTQVSGTTVTGTTSSFTSGNFTTLSGATATFTSGVLALGTATNPSLSFASDPNTGIYSPGADQVAVATNGAGRLFVGSTGNIGLSEASPTARLHLSGTNTAGGIKIVDSSASLAAPGIEVIGKRSDGNISSCFAGKLLLSKNRTDAAINSTGVLGSVAFGGNHTDGTEANILYSASIVGAAEGAFNSATDMPTALVFNTGATGRAPDTANVTTGTERLRITSAGLVGIGTSSPATLLHLSSATGSASPTPTELRIATTTNAGDWSTTDPWGRISYYSADASAGGPKIQAAIDAISNGAAGASASFDFKLVSNTDATLNSVMRINYLGQVGIGTTSPSTYLQVASPNSNTAETIAGFGNQTIGNGLQVTTNGNLDWGFNALNVRNLTFSTNQLERARIDSSGRLLVGTSTSYNAPSITGTQHASLNQIHSATAGIGSQLITEWSTSSANGGSSLKLAKSNSGTIGSHTALSVNQDIGSLVFAASDGTNFINAAHILAEVDGTSGANDMPGRLVFSTTADGASSPTERMRIANDGTTTVQVDGVNVFRVSQSGATIGGRGRVVVTNDASLINTFAGQLTVSANASATGGATVGIASDNAEVANTAWKHFQGRVSGGTITVNIFGNGNIQNTNNSYAGISDLKLKENIVDATSQWDDIKALQVRKYNFKEETGQQTHTQIGLVAQEVELISPGLVSESPDLDSESNDLGTVTKSVNYSVLYMKAVKALQEAMERIEQLEQRLTDAGIA